MAVNTDHTGAANVFNAHGKALHITKLAKTNMTETELQAALEFLAAGGTAGTDDGHTIAGVSVLTESGIFTSGTTDAVQVAIQGTGAFTAGSNFGIGSTGITSSLLADFNQNPM